MKRELIVIIICELVAILIGLVLKNIFGFLVVNIILIGSFFVKKFMSEVYLSNKLNTSRNRLLVELLDVTTWELDLTLDVLKLNVKESDKGEIKEHLTIKKFLEMVCKEDEKKIENLIEEVRSDFKQGNYEIEFTMKNLKGAIVPIKALFTIKDVEVKILAGVAIDLTKQIEQDKKIKDSEKAYRLAVQGSRDILFYWNLSNKTITLKGPISDVLDTKKDSIKIENDKFFKAIHKEELNNIKMLFNDCLESKREFIDEEFRIKRKENFQWVSLKGKIYDEDNEKYIYGSISNISDRKEKEQEIERISYYDEITGLPNRRLFKEKVEKIIDEINKEYRNIALVFIDLDNFKYINDTYGHEIGDKLLRAISLKIYEIVKKNSYLARFGGDEFVLLVDNLESFQDLDKILKDIVLACNSNFNIDGIEIHCTVSIGVAMSGKTEVDFEELMKSADLAMYTAKEHGKNKYEYFNDDILKKINREIEIKEGLRKAKEKKELYGVMQPKVLVDSKDTIGFEYLIRWESEKLGFVSPGEFIPIAENTGQIIEIGKYIIEDAIRMCKKLEGYIREDFKIAINLSEVQLRDIGIVDFIRNTLEENEVNPKNIEIEITESIIMESPEKNISTLRKLKDIGMTIALDDFGTGYSSLSYLRVLPIDILKIDKSFIDYIGKEKKSEYIIETIIELSHCFKFKVVAEGVETEEQYNYLKEHECDIIQGYYFSKPLLFDEICDNLKVRN